MTCQTSPAPQCCNLNPNDARRTCSKQQKLSTDVLLFLIATSAFVEYSRLRELDFKRDEKDTAVMKSFLLLLFAVVSGQVMGLNIIPESTRTATSSITSNRQDFLRSSFGSVMAGASSMVLLPQQSFAVESEGTLSDARIKEIVKSDILDRQFLVTGNLTPSIYRPTATFTDEIDTYKMDQWMTGTQKLFVGEKSLVRLVGDVDVTPEKVEFRFDEDLMFRIPFRPTVSLSGKVVLKRDSDGFITSYREFWDQDTWSVLKTAKF